MVCLSGFNATYTHPYVYIRIYSNCTYEYAYFILRICASGGAISIRDPYICAVHQSVPTNRTLSSTGPLSVQ